LEERRINRCYKLFLSAFLQWLVWGVGLYICHPTPHLELLEYARDIEKSTTLEDHLQPPLSFIVHHISLITLVRVLRAWLGFVLERASLREALLWQAIIVTVVWPSDLVWRGNDTLCGEGDPSLWEAPIVKTVPLPLVTLRERRWWWPCLDDLAPLSLCLPRALVANARRWSSEETRHHTCSWWTSGRGCREGLSVLTEPH